MEDEDLGRYRVAALPLVRRDVWLRGMGFLFTFPARWRVGMGPYENGLETGLRTRIGVGLCFIATVCYLILHYRRLQSVG